MSTPPAPAHNRIPPNYADPEPLTFGEALAHILQMRAIALWRRPLFALPLLCALTLVFVVRPRVLLPAACGAALAMVFLVLAYMFCYAAFLRHNRSRGTLCPCCTSRMWQFCCARCREPIPALAYLSGRCLLAHCPHCGFSLSGREALLAWCSTCSYAAADPRSFYAHPTFVIVVAAGRLPDAGDVGGGWQLVPVAPPGRLVLYLPSDQHSSSLMLVIDYSDSFRFDPVFVSRARLALVAADAPGAVIGQLHAVLPGVPVEKSEVIKSSGVCAPLAAETKRSGHERL